MYPVIVKALFNQELREIWNTAQKLHTIKAPFVSYEWHVTWQQMLGAGYEPYPLIINNEVIAPFVRLDDTVVWMGGEEISDYQDLIGPAEKLSNAWHALLPFLGNDGVRSLHLRNVQPW